MPKCDLCGEDAGILRKRHKECEERYEAGRKEALALVSRTALSAAELATFRAQLRVITERAFVRPEDENGIITEGWQDAVEAALEDDLLTAEEEASLVQFAQGLSLSQQDLDNSGAWSRMVKAAVIRDILEGKLPQRMKVVGEIPFNLQKGESLVWMFPSTTYYEQRTRTHYEGGYEGVSVRVARGLYYRVGGFRGHPVSTAAMVAIGQGSLGITDRHIYFASPAKALRVKYDKVVSFTPYSDGIGIQRDAQSAKPQVFVTGDGWYTYNLVTNLAKRTAA